jgi:hypothetical protein
MRRSSSCSDSTRACSATTVAEAPSDAHGARILLDAESQRVRTATMRSATVSAIGPVCHRPLAIVTTTAYKNPPALLRKPSAMVMWFRDWVAPLSV